MRRVPLAFSCLSTLALCLLPAFRVSAQVTVYHDRATFTAAVSGLTDVAQDTFESYSPGDIALGDARGSFRYTFDPSITQPAVVPGGNGGQALGGSPFGVFVGGDAVTLTYVTTPALLAFGADILYAPSFDAIPGDTYRLGIGNGNAAGQFAGNLGTLDTAGGTFFLGLIVDRSYPFTSVKLFSVQLDPNVLVPAYQADDLIYAAVPEPGALALFMVGGLMLFARVRRK